MIMKDKVQEIYNDASEYLRDNIEHQNKQIDYILINPSNDELWVMCSDGVDTAIELHYKDGMMKNNYVPEWDYNFDYYVYNLLEDGYKIGYISDDLHYSLWNSIHELYPDDIEFKNGVKNYIKYCKNNHINKDYIDKKTNLLFEDAIFILLFTVFLFVERFFLCLLLLLLISVFFLIQLVLINTGFVLSVNKFSK